MKHFHCAARRTPVITLLLLISLLVQQATALGHETDVLYEHWSAVGRLAAEEALKMMEKEGLPHGQGTLVAMTNAGYAKVNGAATQPALDGLARVTGASRGKNSLIEIHSDSQSRLWFAIYDTRTGACAFLQIKDQTADTGAAPTTDVFSIRSLLRVNADHLFANVTEAQKKFDEKPFAGNEFRIVTIANAVAKNAPAAAVRTFEFHDHYCPGVSSGILLATFIDKHFPRGEGSYFVHALDPWCKEDALLVLLNTTPGKKSYAISYPTDEDKARWKPEAQKAATIIYRQKDKTSNWEGRVLAFEWGENGCPKTSSKLIDKLCADLWFLEKMEAPEQFVKVIKEFDLPEGVHPRDWARPGVDPMAKLQLLKE